MPAASGTPTPLSGSTGMTGGGKTTPVPGGGGAGKTGGGPGLQNSGSQPVMKGVGAAPNPATVHTNTTGGFL